MSKIKEATDDSIYFAFDTHSEEASQAITSKVISSKGLGGKLITLLPVPEAVAKLRPEVTMQSESVLFYLRLVADFARYMALLRVRRGVVSIWRDLPGLSIGQAPNLDIPA